MAPSPATPRSGTRGAPGRRARRSTPGSTSTSAPAADPVDGEDLRVGGGGPLAGRELVDPEHELHRVGGRLRDRPDDLAVDAERDVLGRPLGRVDVKRARVD